MSKCGPQAKVRFSGLFFSNFEAFITFNVRMLKTQLKLCSDAHDKENLNLNKMSNFPKVKVSLMKPPVYNGTGRGCAAQAEETDHPQVAPPVMHTLSLHFTYYIQGGEVKNRLFSWETNGVSQLFSPPFGNSEFPRLTQNSLYLEPFGGLSKAL